MLIDYEIFKWLIDSQVLPRPERPHVRADTKVELDGRSADLIKNGMIFIKIIRILKRQAQSVSKLPLQTPPNLKQMKDANTPGAKVYNWNIVVEALAKMNYRVDADIKALIIAGDEDMILEVLKEVYRFIMKFNKLSGNQEKPGSTASSVDSSNDVIDKLNFRYPNKGLAENVMGGSPNYTKTINSYKALHAKQGTVNLDYIDIDTPIEDTLGIMELLIVSLSKALSLNSKQSMALLVNGNKYLAHVVAKGIKGNFEPVVFWYKELYAQAKHVLQLIIKEESTGSVPTMLQALKPGLYSKNEEVAQWACRLLSKLAFDFSNVELLPVAWEWFTAQNGGLYAFMACLKRHPDNGPYVVAGITQFGRFNLLELFTIELKRIFIEPLEYIQTMLVMLKPLTEAKFTKDELLVSGIVDFFIEISLKNADSLDRTASPQLRSASLSFLCDIWEIYPTKIEEQEGLANQILLMLKKGIRDHFSSLKMISITYLFRLLENFASERNPFAPIVYKILTFSLIENHEDQVLREQLLLNFITIFKSYSSIPVGVLLEPLAKQIQVSEGTTYVLNLFDLHALDVLANHPKLTLKQAILLLDVLAKIYLNNVSFAYLAGPPLVKIVERFIEEDTMQEYLLEFAKLALSKYYTSVKRKKTKDNFVKKFVYMEDRDDLYVGPTHITPEMEQEILNAQKRSLTINVLRDIIHLNSSILNAKYKTLLAYTNAQIKQLTRHDNKGIKFLLSLFGDADEIIKDYEEETKPSLDKKMIDHQKIPNTDIIAGAPPQEGRDISPPKTSEPKLESLQSAKSNRKTKTPEHTKLSPLKLVDDDDELFGKKANSGTPYENNRYGDSKKELWQHEEVSRSAGLSLANADQESRVSEGNYFENRNKKKAKEANEAKKKAQGAKDKIRLIKAMEEIENIKRKKKDEKMTQEMLDEYKKLKEEKVKEGLKKKIQQRGAELGVVPKTNNYLLKDEDNKEKLIIAPKSRKQELENIMVVDLDEEEYYQKESMTIYIKQNIKKFKYLFNKYCVTGAKFQREKSFDKLRVQYNTINQVAVLRMIKDNGLHPFISKEEAAQLFKLVNTKLLNSEDFAPYNFEGFVKFITQLGIYIYAKPPLDQAHPNYVDCLKKLMFVIYLAAQGRGEHKQMADDVHHGGDVDKMELEALNRQIQDNPNMMLPPGYKRNIENHVHHEFSMPRGLHIKPSFKVAYEVLHDILNEQFGFHLIESKAVFNTHVKVVPHVVHEVAGVNRGRARLDKSEFSESRGKSNDFDTKKKINHDNRSNREVSVDRFGNGLGGVVKKIVNKAMEEKQKKAEDEKRKQDELDERRRKRNAEVQARMREISEQKKQKEAKIREERKQEEEDKDEIERLKDEKKRKDLERKKQMVDNYRDRKEQENKRKEEREKEEAVKKVEARKQQAISLKRQTDHMKHLLEDKKNQRIEQENVKSQKEEEEKKKADLKKQKVGVTLEKEKEKREKEKYINAEIIRLHESPQIQAFYSAHAKSLGAVFKHYKESATRDILNFKELMTMGAQLNIFPSLVSSEQLKLIFRSLTRDKKEVGLTYNDFLQALLRIGVKAQPILNRLAEQFRGRNNVGSNLMHEFMDTAKREFGQMMFTPEQQRAMQMNENYDRNNVNNAVEDTYQTLAGTNSETLEGLYLYLDLPNDPKLLQEKLKSLRIENQKIVAPRDKKRVVQSIGGNQRNTSRSPAPVNKKPGNVKLTPISSTGQKSLHNNPMSTVQSPPSKRTLQDQSQESLSPGRNQYQYQSQSPMREDPSPVRDNSPMRTGHDSSVSPTRGGREEIVAVDPNELRDSSPETESNIVNPSGKKEKWGIKSLFGKKK